MHLTGYTQSGQTNSNSVASMYIALLSFTNFETVPLKGKHHFSVATVLLNVVFY